MKIRARDGKTSRGFRSYTDMGALAHAIDAIEAGQAEPLVIEQFEGVDGRILSPKEIQVRIGSAKSPGSVYRTKSVGGNLHVWRIA